MRRVEYSLQADKDLEDILAFSFSKFGEVQTIKYFKNLEAHIFKLANNPYIGKAQPEIEKTIRNFVYESHIVFYHFDDSKLRVERVLHGRSDYFSLKLIWIKDLA